MAYKVIATGSALPKKIVTNKEMESIVDTTDEWIFSHTGVRARRIAVEETSLSLASEAAVNAMEKCGVTPADVGLVVCATLTPDSVVPYSAAEIRKSLGIEKCPAYDLNAACTGFIYAVATAKGLMEIMDIDTAVVVGCDLLSKITNWEDRSTCILFGDGAGAVVIKRTEEDGILGINVNGVNDVDDVLTCDWPEATTCFVKEKEKAFTKIKMDGHKVFTFAINALIETIGITLEKADITMDQIKLIVPHQANERIIRSTARRLSLPMEKFFINVGHVGNTSAASVPIALDELAATGMLSKGDLVLIAGFGGGLTYGSAILRW